MRDLPPLNGLRVFEAAARHLSFTKAAAELHVTPAAVSQQVKLLEAYFDLALFGRVTRGLVLTDAGQRLLPDTSVGLNKLAAAVRSTRLLTETNNLTVSVSLAFAAHWLVPRLESFRQAHPMFDIRVDANDRLVNFDRDSVDVAIRYGAGEYAGVHSEPLFANYLFPVCSPELISGASPIRSPHDLKHHRLLHLEWKTFSHGAPVWDDWLRAAGVQGVSAERGPRFTSDTLGVQAALEGQGVLLTSTALVSNELAKGNLVRPFGSMQEAVSFTYYLVYPLARADEPHIQAFSGWIRKQFAEDV